MAVSKGWRWGVTVALLLVAGWVVTSTLRLAEHRCKVCMEFRGRQHCQDARGNTREEALRTAIQDACDRLAAGMTDTIACQQRPPTSVECSEP